jgi:peptidyl-prolyl cis-trans isomerase C
MLVERVDFSAAGTAAPAPVVARVNGVELCSASEAGVIAPQALRQRACTELLRQAAQRAGLLDAADAAPADGVTSEAASRAIEAWLEQQIVLPEPSDDACRRYHAAHAARFSSGVRARLRHILFAVTPGTDVVALRNRAEACLLDVRCHDGAAGSAFGDAARTLSNCPSGAEGGELGWLAPAECAPEFAREIFHGDVREVGVLPRLVHSRFGLHVVEVQAREGGVAQAFESVRGAVVISLRQQAYVTALRQLLQVLAGEAVLEGVQLEAADSPLVQ